MRGTTKVWTWLFVALMVVLTVGGAIGESYPTRPNNQVMDGYPAPTAPWQAYLLVGVAALALGWRRRCPWWVLGVTIAAVGAYTALGYVNGAALVSPLVALYTVATVVPLRDALVASAVTLVPLGVLTAVFNPFATFSGSFPVFVPLVAVATSIGVAVANRRGRVVALEARAELAERTREEEARRRVDAERLRIARELHDVVAHTMSTINVQAGAIGYAHPDLPEPVLQALAAIKEGSKRGLSELRAILSVLRQVDEHQSTAPVPGLNALGTLVATITKAGLTTQVETTGTEQALPAPVDLAAYRIIQESLTNALRHAAPATATVHLTFEATDLDIEVSDTGPGPKAGADPGHGLRGMTERATAIGGTLTAGPGPRGGFLVHARLPLEIP